MGLGLPFLDRMFEEIPQGTFLALRGFRELNELMIQHFLYEGLEQGETVGGVFLVFEPTEFLAEMEAKGFRVIDRIERVKIIDAISWKLKGVKRYKNVRYVFSLSNLNELLARTNEVISEGIGRLSIDSVSELTLYSSASEVAKFLKSVNVKAKRYGFFVLAGIEKNLHTKEELAILEKWADAVIELSTYKGKAYARIRRFWGYSFAEHWIPLKFGKFGLSGAES